MLFSQIQIGAKFHFNGNDCLKVSSRTAMLLSYGRVFYFKATDNVKVIK